MPPWDPAQSPDVAILVALPEEFQHLAAEYAAGWHSQSNPDHPGSDFLFLGPGGYRCVAAIMPRMGPMVAAQVSARLLEWRPAVIINVGIAGGFKDDLCIGDVIVPGQVHAYDETAKMKGVRWERRGADYRPSADLLAQVQELRFTDPAGYAAWATDGEKQLTSLRTGPDQERVDDLLRIKLLRSKPIVGTKHLASGSFVVASKPFAEFIREANADIHAGEMEAAGMLAAVEYWLESVQTLVVRGISDHVDADKGEVDEIGDGALRRLAMANAWRLVSTLMSLGRLPRSAAEASATEPKISRTRLTQGARHLFGRDAELASLDEIWDAQAIKVVAFVAWGGVGKTALVSEWRDRLLARGGGVESVFEWSFYSQGASERAAVSADNFLREALIFFGDPELAESKASAIDKGERLAELVGAGRSLLILDGLEPLQHPPTSAGSGKLKEQGVAVLLRGLASRSRGLCVVTTREAVRELERFEGRTARSEVLAHLGKKAGSELLRSLLEGEAPEPAVTSTAAQREEISEAVQGHALTLQLLGSYIRRALGDIRAWKEVDLRRADDRVQGGHAFRVMDAYVRWLSGGEGDRAREQAEPRPGLAGAASEGEQQLAVLRLIGLFDRPADPGCIGVLREAPVIQGLTEALAGLDRQGWRLLVSSLEQARLLTHSEYAPVQVYGYDEEAARKTDPKLPSEGGPEPWSLAEHEHQAMVLDAHPLVREYFAHELKQANPVGWREGHGRLYEHLRDSVPHWPEGVEGLQPLYQAVAHGCAAGRVQEACDAVYHDRISRGARFYSIHQLGAVSADLGAVACFFERAWDRPSTVLSEADRAWVLGTAASWLRGLGRLGEALEPMRAGLGMHVELEDWKNASVAAGRLSELELTLGRVRAAVDDAQQAVEHAERSGEEFQRMSKRTTLADARHQAGEHAAARELFEEAESMKARQRPSSPELSSISGHRYCDLLLNLAERAAWGGSWGEGQHLDLCAEVFARARRALAVARRHRWLLSAALDQLTLGRAALYAVSLRGEPPAAASVPAAELSLECAREQLEAAVAGLRDAGQVYELPRGLLTRAWLRHLEGDPERARADLDEAMTIAERGPMPLFQADVHLHRARLFHDREALAAARELITRHGYDRRLPELESAERAAPTWPSK